MSYVFNTFAAYPALRVVPLGGFAVLRCRGAKLQHWSEGSWTVFALHFR